MGKFSRIPIHLLLAMIEEKSSTPTMWNVVRAEQRTRANTENSIYCSTQYARVRSPLQPRSPHKVWTTNFLCTFVTFLVQSTLSFTSTQSILEVVARGTHFARSALTKKSSTFIHVAEEKCGPL
jgi:hypothetical protein